MSKTGDVLTKIGNILLHPAVVFGGAGIGAWVGLTNRELAMDMAPYGQIYLALLQMCVIPIMVSAVMSSLGKMFIGSGDGNLNILSIFMVFIVGMLAASIITISVATLWKPGENMSQDSKEVLGTTLAKSELSGDADDVEGESSVSLLKLLKEIAPSNIFRAAGEGRNLSILFFSVLVGVAIGLLKTDESAKVVEAVSVVYSAMLKIIGWLLYGLPFGLCFLFAESLAQLGIGVFFALGKLVALLYFISLLLIVGYTLVIWRLSGRSLSETVYSLKEPLMVSFGTASSFATLPSAIKSMNEKLKFDKNNVDLVLPLGICLNPQGDVVQYLVGAIFMAQLYGVELGAAGMTVAVISTMLAAIASSGAPGVASLAMFGIVLEPLGLPVSMAIILLTAINPIADPIVTTLNVQANCAASAVASSFGKKEPEQAIAEASA